MFGSRRFFYNKTWRSFRWFQIAWGFERCIIELSFWSCELVPALSPSPHLSQQNRCFAAIPSCGCTVSLGLYYQQHSIRFLRISYGSVMIQGWRLVYTASVLWKMSFANKWIFMKSEFFFDNSAHFSTADIEVPLQNLMFELDEVKV